MNEYRPTSRRPISEFFRRTGRRTVRVCMNWGIHPDVISYLSIVASAGAALCFWKAKAFPVLLIVGPILCYVRLWLNMLDGMVAVASGRASWRGEILNDLPDRVSDVLIFVGVAHSGLNATLGGYVTAIFALLTAYVGMLGQAVGVHREFSGIMSKPWRMVALHIGAWITLGLLWWGDGRIRYGGWTILDWTHLIIILGCVQTIWVRLARIMRALHQKATGGAKG
ncbi:MAG: CDP-alcohol phosphatidyltransferase family protein [Candidatus Methylomirabilales bacterium]